MYTNCTKQFHMKRPLLKKTHRLRYNHTLVYTNSACTLRLDNKSYDVLKHCNGENTVQGICYKLSEDYQSCTDYTEICDILNSAYNCGWLD